MPATTWTRRLTSTTVATLVLAAETIVLVAGWQHGTLLPMVTAHLLISGLVIVWALQPAFADSQYGLLLAVATAAFGPLGPAGVLLTTVLAAHYRRHATGIEEWHAMLFPPSHIDEQAELWRRIGQRASDLPSPQQVTPFLDVLTFGSVPQRQSVIAIIVQQFHPAFAPALKAALRDEHNVIRVQAATAIARLENEFLDKTMRLEAAVRNQPGNPAAILALASHYDNQAFTGLLDATREEDCRVRAADGYARYLEVHPSDAVTRFRLGRLQHRRRRFDDAERLFRQLADEGHPSAHHWLMEVLFVQHRYADLRAVAAQYGSQLRVVGDPAAPEVADAIALWRGQETAA